MFEDHNARCYDQREAHRISDPVDFRYLNLVGRIKNLMRRLGFVWFSTTTTKMFSDVKCFVFACKIMLISHVAREQNGQSLLQNIFPLVDVSFAADQRWSQTDGTRATTFFP